MRRLKKLLAMLLSLAMIMTNMTSVFAWHGDSSCKQTKYSHVAIAVYTEDGGSYVQTIRQQEQLPRKFLSEMCRTARITEESISQEVNTDLQQIQYLQ